MSSNDQSFSLYRFDINGGQITAVYESENGRVKQDHIDWNETYTMQGNDVVKQENDHGRLQTTRYTDSDGDGWYAKLGSSQDYGYEVSTATSSESTGSGFTSILDASVTNSHSANSTAGIRTNAIEKYQFDVQSGQVVAAYETENGRTKQEHLDWNETYTVSGSQIVKTETSRYGQEITTYADDDANGLFVKVSEQWVPAGNTNTNSTVSESSNATFADATFGDDHLEVHEGRGVRGGEGADTFTVRGSGAMAVTDFDHTQGDQLQFDTGLGVRSVQELLEHVTEAQYDGKDFHLKLDQGMELTLVGVNLTGMSLTDLSVVS